MNKLHILIIVGFWAMGCADNGPNSGDNPGLKDTGYIPSADTGEVDTGFDTDPTDIPDIDFSMPCLNYKLFSYNSWLSNGGEAFAINDDDIAVGRMQNMQMGGGGNALYMTFMFQHFNSFSERHYGTVFSGAYYYYLGLPALELDNVYVVDVNKSGVMAGQGNHEDDQYVHAGYMEPDGSFHRLFADETQSIPTAINDPGQIVGYNYNTYIEFSSVVPIVVEESQGFLWHDDVTPPTYLNPLPGAPANAQVEPHDINNAGQVVGGAVDVDGRWQAFIWEDGPGYTVLETLGGGEAVAHGVNNTGVVVGESLDASDVWKPVVWDATGTITDLGLFTTEPMKSGVAQAVNDNGTVVGWDVPVYGLAYHRAWVWQDGVKTDLTATNNPHNRHHFAEAHDINNNGVIVGRTMVYNSGPFAFALIPQDCGTELDTDMGN